VLTGNAELVAGEPLPLEETFAARREFVKQRRQQQEARRQRAAGEQAQRAKRSRLGPDVDESIDDMPVLTIADVGMHPQAGMTKSTRPRKRADVAEGADAAGVETNGHNADVHVSEGEV
jgi:hypothetical protein